MSSQWKRWPAHTSETVRMNVRRWAERRGHSLTRFEGGTFVATTGRTLYSARCRVPGCGAKAYVHGVEYRGSAVEHDCPFTGREGE